MQVTRVFKFIVLCFQAAKIYTMNTFTHLARSQGVGLGAAAIEMETIAGRLHRSEHVYLDDLFALSPCVCVFKCLSWHENGQATPARCVTLHTQTYTYISVNGSCQHDSYKDNTNVTDVCRAGNDTLSLGNVKGAGTEYLLNLSQELMR